MIGDRAADCQYGRSPLQGCAACWEASNVPLYTPCRDYAAIVFFANNRFETGKKKLQYLSFGDFAFCAELMIQNWTLGAVGESPFPPTDPDPVHAGASAPHFCSGASPCSSAHPGSPFFVPSDQPTASSSPLPYHGVSVRWRGTREGS